ncbi:MAG: T9SS type A sorting domain-containing protein [Muribaculaceae bacterium]|nr:T9SS type A sorting domain-containing protein [Muribaculaceae bacterium]
MKSLKSYVLLALLLMAGGVTQAQTDLDALMAVRGEYFFSIQIQQPEEAVQLTRLCSIDKMEGDRLICYANAEQYQQLLAKGYRPTLLTPPSMQEEYAMWDGSNREAYDWDAYPTYEAYQDMMKRYAEDYPERCTYIDWGTLASGRKLMFCRFNNGEPDGKPKFLYTSTIHGDELTGMMLMLRLIDELCTSDDPRILNLIDQLDIFISPCTNPDGTYHGGNNTVYGARRNNANDADLNRNYPDFDDGPHPDGREYQPETLMMMELAEQYLFTMAANYHGGAELLNYPWDTYQPLHPDDDWWKLVCHEYADLTHEHDTVYMSDFNNGIVNGYVWFPIYGSRQDYMNYYAQCREVTIECSFSHAPNPSLMPMYWTYNHESMLRYMEQCLYGIHGTVTDSVTGEPLKADVTIYSHDHHGSAVSSHLPAGDYHRPIKGGTYEVTFSCEGYYPKTFTLTVGDGETLVQDVQLVPEGYGVEEDGPSTGSGALVVYPNPTNGVLSVETHGRASLPPQTYRITNLMGQTLLTGKITAETQQIDVSALPEGMYFITFAGKTQKFVVR